MKNYILGILLSFSLSIIAGGFNEISPNKALEKATCIICRDEFNAPVDQILCGNAKCKLGYHESCIRDWFRSLFRQELGGELVPDIQNDKLICVACCCTIQNPDLIKLVKIPARKFISDLQQGRSPLDRKTLLAMKQALEQNPEYKDQLLQILIYSIKRSAQLIVSTDTEFKGSEHFADIEDIFNILPSLVKTSDAYYNRTLYGRIQRSAEYMNDHVNNYPMTLHWGMSLSGTAILGKYCSDIHFYLVPGSQTFEIRPYYPVFYVMLITYMALIERYIVPGLSAQSRIPKDMCFTVLALIPLALNLYLVKFLIV